MKRVYKEMVAMCEEQKGQQLTEERVREIVLEELSGEGRKKRLDAYWASLGYNAEPLAESSRRHHKQTREHVVPAREG